MCLAVPAKVLEISGDIAKVDYGGIERQANISLVKPNIGDYVIIHAGYAIQILDPEEAAATLETWNEYFDFLDGLSEPHPEPHNDKHPGPQDAKSPQAE